MQVDERTWILGLTQQQAIVIFKILKDNINTFNSPSLSGVGQV